MNIKLLFFPLSIVVLSWSVIVITKPAWDEYKIKKTEFIKLSAEKQKLETGVMNIKKALVAYNNLDADIKTYVGNAIPVDREDDNLIAEVNKGISQSGVLVTRLASSEKKAVINPKCRQAVTGNNLPTDCTPKASNTNVSLSAIGSYPMVKDFLGRLDTQNRIIIPKSLNLVSSDNQNKEDDISTISLITAKVEFNVLQKKPIKIKSFSNIMSSDVILKSLLNNGLSINGLNAVNKFIASDIFTPVQANGTGKDDLFKNSNIVQKESENIDN